MKYGRYGWSHMLISWGLGITFLWIGIDMVRNPNTWIGFLPQGLPGNMSRESALMLTATFDSALGAVLLLRIYTKTAAFLASLHLVAIIIQHGLDAVLIRDVGLLGASLSLLAWPSHYHKRRWLSWRHKREEQEE